MPARDTGLHLCKGRTIDCRVDMPHIRQSRPESGLGLQAKVVRGTTRAEDDQGTPTQSHISPKTPTQSHIAPSILIYEDITI